MEIRLNKFFLKKPRKVDSYPSTRLMGLSEPVCWTGWSKLWVLTASKARLTSLVSSWWIDSLPNPKRFFCQINFTLSEWSPCSLLQKWNRSILLKWKLFMTKSLIRKSQLLISYRWRRRSLRLLISVSHLPHSLT